MPYRKYNVSTRTLLQLTIALLFMFFVSGVGAALAANSGVAPVLIPSTINVIAGDTHNSSGGYGGDGQLAETPTVSTPSTVNATMAVAVDSVGNVYFADTGNVLIREINAQTGFINIVAGVKPSGCVGVLCSNHPSGCSDGVPALGSPIGAKINGLTVDSYGNIYFVDTTSSTVSVIYKAGKRVADFIKLVNPGGVAKSGGVIPGYIYHIAGTVNLSTCTATLGNYDGTPDAAASGTTPATTYSGGALAFEDSSTSFTLGASLHSPGQIGLDSAGNIYVQDVSNNSVRVINTQYTPQTFFQFTVQPGFMKAIVNCSAALTAVCPASTTANSVGTGLYPGIGGPASMVTYSSALSGLSVDAYGNVYELNNKGAVPAIYAGVAFAGGTPLTHLLSIELATGGPVTNTFTNQTTPVYGDFYSVIGEYPVASQLTGSDTEQTANCCNSTVIRPVSYVPDALGNLYLFDNHYPELMRVDVNSQTLTDIIGSTSQRTISGNNYGYGLKTAPPTVTNPIGCAYGTTSSPWPSPAPAGFILPQTTDVQGNGCPAQLAAISVGSGGIFVDGPGNIYMAENGSGFNDVRILPVGNKFPATAMTGYATSTGAPLVVAGPVTQAIQVHFDAGNQPLFSGASFNMMADASTFTIAPGLGGVANPDFVLDSVDNVVPLYYLYSGLGLYKTGYSSVSLLKNVDSNGAPAMGCVQPGLAIASPGGTDPDYGVDCLVYVTFNPTAPGLRVGQLVATTKNGSVYNFPLTGIGIGGQLAIDGGQYTPVGLTGLSATGAGTSSVVGPSAVAVNTAGVLYTADPVNNRIVVLSTNKVQTQIGGTGVLILGKALSGPKGVAVDTANNVYISDTGNNRVLQINPITNVATQLGNNRWISGASQPLISATATYGTGAGAEVYGNTSATTAPPQYQFNAPQGLAVDSIGNVYVADTGNHVVVEIPSNPNLGGAFALLENTGVTTTFTTPVAVAVDYNGNVYVADTGNLSGEIVEIPAGGGEFIGDNGILGTGKFATVLSSSFGPLPLIGGQGITSPNGVAVDGGGNVYISDSTTGTVWVAPAASGPTGTPYILNITGLSAPAGLALDSNANLYVADAGSARVVFEDRQNPSVSFGTIPQYLPPSGIAGISWSNGGITAPFTTSTPCPITGDSDVCSGVLTITNVGNAAVTKISSPIYTVKGTANPAFNIASTGTNACGTTLAPGAMCVVSPTFTPQDSTSSQSESIFINGTAVVLAGTTCTEAVCFAGTDDLPLATVKLASSAGTTLASTVTTTNITATVTQPHNSITPTGTVTFYYEIDAGTVNANLCGTTGKVSAGTATLNASGVATIASPTLSPGLQYTFTAVYSGDTYNKMTITTIPSPLTVIVSPAAANTVTVATTAASSAYTYTYGSVPPAITGTFTPALPTGITATLFGSGAGQYSNIQYTTTTPATPIPWPIQVQFKGTNFCAYGSPSVLDSAGKAATQLENPAALTVSFPSVFTAPYGASDITFSTAMSIKGAVGTDLGKLSATFTTTGSTSQIQSSIFPVVPTAPMTNPYPVIPSMTGKPINNYAVSITNGSLVVTPAPTSSSVAAAKASLLPNAFGTFTGTIAANSPTITNVTGGLALSVGQTVTGAGIPDSTTVTGVGSGASAGTITLSANATASASGVTLTAVNPGNFVVSEGTLVTAGKGTPTGTVYVSDTFVPFITTVPGTSTPVPACSIYLTGITTNGSAVVTGISSAYGLAVGQVLSGLGIPSGTTYSAPGIGSFTMSGKATASNSNVLITATQASGTTCNPTIPVPLLAGNANYTPTSTAVGTHYYGFAYGGDSNFQVNAVSSTTNLIIDYADFTLTTTSGVVGVAPGATPSGNGLPASTKPDSANLGSAAISISPVLGETGIVNLTCATQHPTWVFCSMTPTSVTIPSAGTIQTSILSVWTPATLPLGFSTAHVRTSSSKTAWAFLPLGVLAFCVRRRRKLSKALWMLIAVAAVSAGMSGCGGNQVDFYTPVPQGPQTVTITGTGTSITTATPVARSLVVGVSIN